MINKRLGSYALNIIHFCNPAFCAGVVLCMVSFAWWPMLPAKSLITLPTTMLLLVAILSGCLVMISLIFHKVGYFIAGVIIACVYCHWIGHQYTNAIKSIEFDTPMWVEGTVTTLQNTDHLSAIKATVVLRVSHINSQSVTPILIRLNWYYPKTNLRQGQDWKLLVKLKPARGLANAAGFDYQRYLIGQHIVATGYIKPHANNQWLSGSVSLAQQLSLQVEQYDYPHQGWINALMMGHKQALSTSDKQLIRDTGTAHLFVISGLHIGIVAAWIALVCRFTVTGCTLVLHQCGINVAKISQPLTVLLVIVGTFLYCTLLGFTIPMLRAYTVICLWLLLNYWHVQIGFLHKYLLCLVVVCVVFPLSSFNTGFWLSFAAVSAIVFITHIMAFNLGTWRQKIRAFIVLQLALSCVLIPINILFFQHWLPASLLANLWAIPWVTLVLVTLGMVTLLAGVVGRLFPDLSGVIGWIYEIGIASLDFCFGWLIAGLQLFGHNEILEVVFSPVNLSMSFILCVLFLIAVTLALLMHRQFQAQITLLLCLIGVTAASQTAPATIDVHIMDVGQGSGALLVINNEALVFDVGDDFGANFNMVDHVLRPYLQHMQVKSIPAVYISHADKDHAGGINRLVSAFPDMQVIDEKNGCVSGYQQSFHAVQLTVLWPLENMGLGKKNDRSCVIQLQIGQHRVLFTGDIEAFAEEQLILAHDQGLIDLSSDILIVPHHGSNSSSTNRFIHRVAPSYAIISAGYMNRYQLPKGAVVDRYLTAGSQVLNTAVLGQISVQFSTAEQVPFTITTKRGSTYTSMWAYRWYQFD